LETAVTAKRTEAETPISGARESGGGRVPVAYDAEIVVVGAGPGGFAAALQAARMGISVIVIERFDMPGGVHTSGLQGAASAGVGGIHTELMERLARDGHIYTVTESTLPDWGGNPLAHYDKYVKPGAAFVRQSFNPEGAGNVMAAMLAEAGVRTLYGMIFVDAVVEKGAGNGFISAVIVEGASGRQAITGRIFIDGSGTGQLAASAGVPYVEGGGGQPGTARWDGVDRPIPGGLLWMMTGIRFSKVVEHQKSAGDPTLSKLIGEAAAAGDLPAGLYRPRMGGTHVYGDLYIGHPTIDMSPMLNDGTFIFWQNVPYEWALRMDTSAEDEARAHQELRGLIDAEAKFLRKYVPGFEGAVLIDVGRFVGVRDGRHPVGEHTITLEDVLSGRQFPDTVTRSRKRPVWWKGRENYEMQVPFRCFLPKGVGNLILTGASLSLDYRLILQAMRGFPWCIQTGEIAGYAAARCIGKNVSPKELEWTAPYF
jgi:hypothetical protein